MFLELKTQLTQRITKFDLERQKLYRTKHRETTRLEILKIRQVIRTIQCESQMYLIENPEGEKKMG